jgi:hypothetical protein
MYPHNFSHTTKHGWPAFWMLRIEYGDVFVPSSTKIDYWVLSWNLAAVDLVAWIAVFMATAHVSWRMCSSRGQFSLRFLFSITTVAAILLAWWRLEFVCCFHPNPTDADIARLFAETPMLRMLRFPPDVYVPLLLGIGCLILYTIDVTFYVLGRAQTRWYDLLKRTASKESK